MDKVRQALVDDGSDQALLFFKALETVVRHRLSTMLQYMQLAIFRKFPLRKLTGLIPLHRENEGAAHLVQNRTSRATLPKLDPK